MLQLVRPSGTRPLDDRHSRGARDRRRSFLVAALLLAAPAGARSVETASPPDPESAFRSLRAATQKGAGDAELKQVLALEADPIWESRARLLRAESAYRRGDHDASRRELESAVSARPDFLGAYAQYLLALLDRDQATGRALSHFAASFERAGPTLLRYRAGIWLADSYRERGDEAGALALLQTLREMPLDEALRADVEVRCALLLQSMGREKEARALLADLYLSQPLLGYRAATIPIHRIAREALEGHLDELPAERRLARAETLERSRLHRAARGEAQALLTADRGVRERARLLVARTLLAERSYKPALAELAHLLPTSSVGGEARLLHARALRAVGKRPEAERELVSLTASSAHGSARFRAAVSLARELDEKDPVRAAVYWRLLASEREEHEFGAEALWEIAWRAYGSGDATAARAFAAYAAAAADTGTANRGTYWAARALERQGRAGDAALLYASVATLQPGSYYALAATRRLEALAPEQAHLLAERSAGEAARAELRSDPLREAAPSLLAALGPAREMALLGFTEDALAEAQFQTRRFPDDPAPRLVVAEAYHEAGDFMESVRWLRRAFPGATLESIPAGYWSRLYPLSFWESIERYSRHEGVDPYLAAALIYQESRFRPVARSSAGACGLMQLLPGTAREVARSLKEPVPAVSLLFDPDRNVRYGMRYLRRMLDAVGGRAVLALAGYNAGSARVRRWSATGPLDPEEFVEAIPFQETRDYVKSILVAHQAYHRVYAPDSICAVEH